MSVRVLLVDDEPELRSLWSEVLEAAGFGVTEAASLAEARSVLPGGGYDVAIVDWTLPDGNGAQVVAEVRAADPSCATLIVSGLGPMLPDGHGADAVLAKPFRLRELIGQVKRLGGVED